MAMVGGLNRRQNFMGSAGMKPPEEEGTR
jgi:hypothetical protein